MFTRSGVVAFAGVLGLVAGLVDALIQSVSGMIDMWQGDRVNVIEVRRAADDQVTFDGYGPLRLGMTREQALASSPVALTQLPPTKDCVFLVDQRGGPDTSQRLSALVDRHTDRVIGIHPPAEARTDRGPRVGSNRSEVVAAYPTPARQEVYSQVGHVLLVPGPDDQYVLGFVFGETGNAVLRLDVGRQDYAAQAELCSGG